MLTVLTWLWAQAGARTAYTAAHVNIWAAMVRRHLAQPARLACVTDMPAGIDPGVDIIAPPCEFEDVVLPTWGAHRPQCLRRLSMFRPDAAAVFGERFVCMDLDCVIGGPLDPLFDTRAAFKIFAGTAAARPYNGSMMLLVAGSRPQVYERFSPEGAVEAGRRYVGSDQAWITHVLGRGEATWGPADGVSWWGQGRLHGETPHLVFFPGGEKPWQVAEDGGDAWVGEHYCGARRGRCLILGYAPTVWADLEAALDQGPFEAVIASPEAAQHWRGELLAVAGSDVRAERLARMHGFEDVVFCGRTERRSA